MGNRTNWWSWDGENLTDLGEHEDIEDAWEAADSLRQPCHWVFSKEALEDFVTKAQGELRSKS